MQTSAVQNGNLVEIYTNRQKSGVQNTQIPNMGLQQDTVTFNEMGVKLKQSEEKSMNCDTLEGTINGKNACIKGGLQEMGNDYVISYLEGTIGDKKILIQSDPFTSKTKYEVRYRGKYGDKDVDLVYMQDKPSTWQKIKNALTGKVFFPDNIAVLGKIGDKQVQVVIPGAKVPGDSDTKDMVSLLMANRGFMPTIINGKIIGYNIDKDYRNYAKRKAEENGKIYDDYVKPLFNSTTACIISGVVGILIGKIGRK